MIEIPDVVVLEVLQEDIDKAAVDLIVSRFGRRCFLCPVAQAAMRQLGVERVAATGGTVDVEYGGAGLARLVCRDGALAQFVRTFDNDGVAKPCTIKLYKQAVSL